jgi:hypothetical protein
MFYFVSTNILSFHFNSTLVYKCFHKGFLLFLLSIRFSRYSVRFFVLCLGTYIQSPFITYMRMVWQPNIVVNVSSITCTYYFFFISLLLLWLIISISAALLSLYIFINTKSIWSKNTSFIRFNLNLRNVLRDDILRHMHYLDTNIVILNFQTHYTKAINLITHCNSSVNLI